MEDELGFQTYLLTLAEALRRLEGNRIYTTIVERAYSLWQETAELQANPAYGRHLALLDEDEAKLAAGLAGEQVAIGPEIDAYGRDAAREATQENGGSQARTA